MEVSELLNRLESNQPEIVEESKKTFREIFLTTKESWLVNGLCDYYLSTSSARSVEILVGVREPHDRHLFDRLSESLRGPSKLQALTLLGHIVRRHPAWIFKIAQHTLLKELLKLLKVETDILPLMSALLILIVLLPMIPALIGNYLQDIFEVFSRLAAWNTNNPNKLPEEHLLHLQVGLYALFQRLYGMYPCNFLSYLRNEYGQWENLGIFSHTIKPMLDTVKMHPLLVTASKDAETATSRWKKMEHHDVLLECAKFSTLDSLERPREEISHTGHSQPLWPRYSLEQSNIESPYQHQIKSTPTLNLINIQGTQKEEWSPSVYCGMATPPPQESVPTSIPQTPNSQSYIVSSSLPHQEGTSPPEAAIEATPETTPIKVSESLGSDKQSAQSLRSKTPGGQPTSPLRSITSDTSIPNSPVHMEPTAPLPGAKEWLVAKPLPEKNGFRYESSESTPTASAHIDSCQEDQEVLEIVRQGEQWSIDTQSKHVNSSIQRQCDSVLQEFHPPHMDDYEECQQESGSPCTSGGLHMPTSRSMREFARRVHQQHRQRFYSQCVPDTRATSLSGFSTGSSPGEGSAFPLQIRVRRANSCPEMKKGPVLPGAEATIGKTLEEREELEDSDGVILTLGGDDESNAIVNGKEEVDQEAAADASEMQVVMKQMTSASTQTVDHWSPLPYEHLFLGAFPSVDQHSHNQNGEVKLSSTPSPAPLCHHTELYPRYSPYVMLDKYIDTVIQGSDKDAKKPKTQGLESELKTVKEQLTLLNIQLQFERHRREAHAERNRRLLGKSITNRALEEHNSALRDQLTLLQKDIENLHNEREKRKKELLAIEQQMKETINYWQAQCNSLQKDNKELKTNSELLRQELNQAKERTATVTKEFQQVESMLFEVGNEMRQAVAQASAGEQLRGDMEQLQKELILMGELQQKYRDRFSQLPLRNNEEEVAYIQDAYCEEIRAINEMLEQRNSVLEAAKARVADLESVMTRRDMIIADQKRVLKQVKEEYQEKLEAVESKYETQRAITQRMESHILELYNQLEVAENISKRKSTRSPDSSGAHEVSIGSSGSAEKPVGPSSFSPHSSPLSESLGSAEGSLSGILGGEGVEMKNLQVIVDQPEQTTVSSSSTEQQPVTSPQSPDTDMASAGNSTPEEEG
ncbi:hamartin isoform X2 [Periplaneta americana]|uniref:hamartin isoform X2 n=1 Tax=Periplaneta americana TaxID=6978 RepID=UPI0037E71352